jgi:hypothetical protein
VWGNNRDAIVTIEPPKPATRGKRCNRENERISVLMVTIAESCSIHPNPAIWPQTRFHGDNTGSNPVG